ncbi:hypothetical protein R4Z10_19110 [Niallia sp. XMNu-256]|uniref:hypothetical protein n=1 Tax=Niallia sp. XMNu-256 TaxID=3082444 RepID=UPI0030CC14F6
MKFSDLNVNMLFEASQRARHKASKPKKLELHFEEPIIHREIQGDRVYVPLNLDKVWNEV